MEDLFYKKLTYILSEDQIKRDELMKNHTTLHIGGAADYFVTPIKTEDVEEVVCLCRQENIPYFILGNGSNLLVSDEGYRGLVINFGEQFSEICVKEDGLVTAQAGVLLGRLANKVAAHSLSGFEFASGIPGSLGGAIAMNAGAYDGEMKQCIVRAMVMDLEGNVLELNNEELELDYRTSVLQTKKYILLEADLKLETGDHEMILEKMKELNARRRDKQPLEQYSCGSTFKRPEGHFAAKLISDAGLKGYQVGGAAVSVKHCGFVVNKDHATAEEFLIVINDVVSIVKDKFNVTLEPEVRFLGEF